MKEIWKKHPILVRYEFSNLGHIRNLKTKKLLSIHTIKRTGQPFVICMVPKNEKWHSKTIPLARRIAELFLGPCPSGLQVVHKNYDKSDNSVQNLVYMTQSDNLRRAYKDGKRSRIMHHNIIPMETRNKIRKEFASGKSQVALSRKYGCNNGTISKIIHFIHLCDRNTQNG